LPRFSQGHSPATTSNSKHARARAKAGLPTTNSLTPTALTPELNCFKKIKDTLLSLCRIRDIMNQASKQYMH
jgi:hypothetical protein